MQTYHSLILFAIPIFAALRRIFVHFPNQIFTIHVISIHSCDQESLNTMMSRSDDRKEQFLPTIKRDPFWVNYLNLREKGSFFCSRLLLFDLYLWKEIKLNLHFVVKKEDIPCVQEERFFFN